MCYKSPQPRCSGHTGKRLVSLDARIETIKLDMKKISAEIAKLIDSKGESPRELESKRKKIERLTRKNDKNYEMLVKNLEDRKVTQRDYDGTPKGQKELKAIINDEKSSPKLVKQCENRLVQGKLMRSWRMNQKMRNDGTIKTYASVREEKNHKIFLNDAKAIKTVNARRVTVAA